MNRDRSCCAYCGEPATTRDHVPPKNIFTPPLPENLVTVPSCAACNNGASDDDEVFRNELSIMGGSFGESENARERIAPSLRSIKRNKSLFEKHVYGASLVDRYSPGGIYLGPGIKVPATPGTRKRVLVRIVRGLYWHHFSDRVSNADDVTVIPIDKSKADLKAMLDAVRDYAPHRVEIGNGNTFQYWYGRATDDPTASCWLLVFFKGSAERIYLADTLKRSGP